MTQKSWRDTVFNRTNRFVHPNERIAVAFHRATVVMYGVFVIWAIASLGLSVPAFLSGDITAFDDWFSLYVIPTSALACLGALYFPRFARLEMFTASALVGLVMIYLGFVFWDAAVLNDESAQRNFWIDIALVIVPLTRVIMIFRSLIRAADDRKDEN